MKPSTFVQAVITSDLNMNMSLSNLARILTSYQDLFSPSKYSDSTFQWVMTFLCPFRFTGIIIHIICLFIFVSMNIVQSKTELSTFSLQ
jgi:hypothetical protein